MQQHPLSGVGHAGGYLPTSSANQHAGGAYAGSASHVALARPGGMPGPGSTNQLHHLSMSQSPVSSDAGETNGFRQPNMAAVAAAKKARKSSQLTEGREDDGEGEDGHARKRSKQSLSCGECKCDRRVPCASCIKRGQPESCSWEDAKIEPERQPFALANDVEDMRARLQLVERFINTLPPALKTSFVELGIKTMGDRPVNDINAADHEFEPSVLTSAYLKSATCKEEAPPDSLSVLDSMIFDSATPLNAGGRRAETAADDPELTPWRTSIRRQPPVYVNPASGVNIGLDICYSQADLDQQVRQVYDRVYKLLPEQEKCMRLIRHYFRQYEWFFAVLHQDTFLSEVDRFWQMYSTNRYEVDPAWLAILFSVLALASDEASHNSDTLSQNYDAQSPDIDQVLVDLGTPLHAAAQRMHTLSDPGGRPQVRTILTITLFACWTIISAHGGGDFGRFASWLAQGIRTGHKLGFHTLTADPESMPPDDPALPPGKNSMKREVVLKLWGFMIFFDHLGGSGRYRSYLIHPAQNSAPPLSNLNWSDYSTTDWKISPAPQSVLTDATLERHKYEMARLARKTFDMLVISSEPFNYGMVHELDREYRELLDAMPDAFQHEFASLEAQDPNIRSRRYIAMQGVHNRIVRLHRPFLVKGWEPNSRFAYSSEACVRSAKVVVLSHHNNINLDFGLSRNLRMLYSHSLTAATVLAADLFHSTDTDASDAEIASKRDNFQLALDIFSETVQQKINSKMMRRIVKAARHVLSGLHEEQQKRHVRRLARKATGQPQVTEPTFAELLHTLSSELDASQAPKTLEGAQQVSKPASHPSNGSTSAPLSAVTFGSYLPEGDPTTTPVDAVDPFPSYQVQPDPKTISSNLMQDIGLINFNGQTWDFWTQPTGGPNVGSAFVDTQATGGGGGGDPMYSNPTDALMPSSSDLTSWFGAGSASEQADKATQALLTQLTNGW
ncbi:hypothetical protein JCM10908_004568 [Rhodotorula pacifica]|uniref:fungal specific transcription factor domain-containing protein n=1 Tax=Rhodotorula pacifica TaxID=1495444 RepID=UPI00317F39A7